MEVLEEKSDSTVPSWRLKLQESIYKRDLIESTPFIDISISYESILDENVLLNSRVSELNQALLKIKSETFRRNTSLLNTLDNNNNDNSNVTNNPTIIEHKNEIESLQKELMDVYRLKREDEEALSRLKKQSIEYEELLIKRRDMLDEMSKNYEKLNNSHIELKNEFIKVKGQLNIMNKENHALRKAHDSALKEIEVTKMENSQLSTKLLKMKETQMDEMNKLHEEFSNYQMMTLHREKKKLENELKLNTNTNNNKNSKNNKLLDSSSDYSRRSRSQTYSPDSSSKSSPLQKSKTFSETISSWFNNVTNSNNNKNNNNKNIKRSKTDDHIISNSGPVVNLYESSIFNITPPQLKQKDWLAHGDSVMCLNYNPRGKHLLSCGKDKTVKLWNINNINSGEICKFRGCEGSVMTCTFSSNGLYVAASGNDCSVHLWNVNTQRTLKKYNGHYNTITSIKFTNNTKKLISGSHDRSIRVWDTEKAACIHNLSASSSVNYIDLSPDEYWMASAHLDGFVRFWSFRDRKELFKFKDHKPVTTNGVQFSPPDGIHVLTSDKNGRLIIWDLRKRLKLMEITNKYYKNSNISGGAIYSPDGQFIIGPSQIKNTNKNNEKYSLYIWKSKTGKLLHTLDEHTRPISYVTWHSKGGVASCDSGGNIFTWI